MVSIDAFAEFKPHPKSKDVLSLTLYKPKGKNIYPGMSIVEVIQRGGLPLLRQYVLDAEGYPDGEYGFRMALPIFDVRDGHYLMLSMDLATGEMQVKVKRSGPTPRLKTPAAQQQPAEPPPAPAPETQPAEPPPAPAPPPPSPPKPSTPGLEGVWQNAYGEAVVFQGNRWTYYEEGAQVDGGVFRIQGNQLVAQSEVTGESMTFLFQVAGNRLLLQDPFGEVDEFVRTK
jgi:hypothetical protein